MLRLTKLERACENNFLWPTIAEAVETFLRRRGCDADCYERIWRLIHIWESVEITLAGAVLARYAAGSCPIERLRKCREYFYGTSWDQVTGTMRRSQGASEGSIDQWINIIEEASKDENSPSPYITSLRAFLQTESIELGPLIQAWSRTCDAPPEAGSDKGVRVRQAMRLINTFRNRLAHVPFPHDPLETLTASLEAITEQLFSVEPPPSAHQLAGKSSPLTGSFLVRGHQLHGTLARTVDGVEANEPQFIFPCPGQASNLTAHEIWPAAPFVHVDLMMRPHALTRVKDEEGTAEYVRFKAEANAVINLYETRIHEVLPTPKASEYSVGEDEIPKAGEAGITSDASFAAAINAIRNEEFDDAIGFFSELTETRPDYHIAWLRLGHARREKAVRLPQEESAQAVQLLHLAIENLTKASEHRDPDYAAQALYERSKAHFHLAKRGHDSPVHYEQALQDANEAMKKHLDWKFDSWLNYLQNAPHSKSIGNE
jgi:hypothetical protein